jgi:cell division septum initiation protein DivIVA
MQERVEQLQDENEELRQQLAALQDDLDEASRQRPGTSGMSSALRQQVMTLQVGRSALQLQTERSSAIMYADGGLPFCMPMAACRYVCRWRPAGCNAA